MSDISSNSAEERAINASQMKVSDTDVAIDVVGMHKWYGDFHALKNIDLEVKEGEIIVVCGPSGSGKSTLLDALCFVLFNMNYLPKKIINIFNRYSNFIVGNIASWMSSFSYIL